MNRSLRIVITVLAFVALASSWPRAQSATGQKPPDAKPAAAPVAATDAQKPAEPPAELPADAKAFNVAASEPNLMKRVDALEKFIADNPKSSQLVNSARNLVSSTTLAAFKDSRAKYLAQIETEVADAKKRTDTTPIYQTYNSIASRLVAQGIFSEEAEDYSRKGLAAMDEKAFMESRKAQYERSLASYEKATAAAANPQAPAAANAEPAAGRGGGQGRGGGASSGPSYRFVTKDGVMQATLAPPPKPAPPRPPTPPRAPVKPTMPTESEMKASFTSLRAPALAALGQILMKRGKSDEGEKVLLEAYAAKPASATMAAIARTLSESARKAGNEKAQIEYLTVLALSGRITSDESKEFEAVYKKTHNGSLDGMEAMLDERFLREHVGFAVTPFVRKPPAKATGRTVLAEVFPGAG